MKKVRVLYDVSVLSNALKEGGSRRGIFFVALNVLKELSRRKDIELFFYCKNSKDKVLIYAYLAAEGVVECRKWLPTGLVFFVRKLKDGVSATKKRIKFKTIRFLLAIARILVSLFEILLSIPINKYFEKKDARGVDVYFSPMHKAPERISKNEKIRRFFIVYDLIPFIFKKYCPEMKTGKCWIQELMNSLGEKDYIFTISKNTKKDLLYYNKKVDRKKIFLTHLAANNNFYKCINKKRILKTLKKYKIPYNGRYILSLCTIEPRKNLMFAIRCFVKFVKKNNIRDLYFIMAGGCHGAFQKQINEKIKKSGCEDLTIQTGYVDDKDLAVLYSAAEIFVYPSLYEGFGLPPLEAMQCGTPVITSNTSSLPEVVGRAGLMVDPENEKELVDTIAKLYYNKKLRQKLSKGGTERAKKFSWDKTVDVMIDSFKKSLR